MRNSFVVLILFVATSYATSASVPYGYQALRPQGVIKTLWLPATQNRFYGVSRKQHLLEAIRHIVKAGNLRQDEVMQQVFTKFAFPWKPSIPKLPIVLPVVPPVIGPSASPTMTPIPIAPVVPVTTPEIPAEVSATEEVKESIALPTESKEKIKQVIKELEKNVEQDIHKGANGADSDTPPKVTQKVIDQAVAKVEKIIQKTEDSSEPRTEKQTESPAIKVAIGADPEGVVPVDIAEKDKTPKEEMPIITERPSEPTPETSGAEALKKLIMQLGSSLSQLMGVIDKVVKTKH